MKIIDDFNLDVEYVENFDHISLESMKEDLNLSLESFSGIEIALEEEDKKSFIVRAWEWIKKVLGKLWNFLTGAERKTDKIAENIAKTAGFSSVKEMDAEAERAKSSGQDAADIKEDKDEEVIKEDSEDETKLKSEEVKEKPKTKLKMNRDKLEFLFLRDDNLAGPTYELYLNMWALKNIAKDGNFGSSILVNFTAPGEKFIPKPENFENKLSEEHKRLKDEYISEELRSNFSNTIAFSLSNLRFSRRYIRECKKVIKDINNNLDSYKKKKKFNEEYVKCFTEYIKFITKKYQTYSKEIISYHNAILKKAKEFAAEKNSKNITVESKLVQDIYSESEFEPGTEGFLSNIFKGKNKAPKESDTNRLLKEHGDKVAQIIKPTVDKIVKSVYNTKEFKDMLKEAKEELFEYRDDNKGNWDLEEQDFHSFKTDLKVYQSDISVIDFDQCVTFADSDKLFKWIINELNKTLGDLPKLPEGYKWVFHEPFDDESFIHLYIEATKSSGVESKLVEAIMEEYGIEGLTEIIKNLAKEKY